MGIIGKDFKYKVIKNFLSPEVAELLCGHTKIKHSLEQSMEPINNTHLNTLDTSLYGDPVMETAMMMKKKHMEEITGKKLFPTYTLWRMYTQYSELPPHKDRPSCEISVTVNLGSDGTKWPIFVEGTPCELEAGDAVIYLGCELKHWREEFKGDWCSQVFIHYVDKEGSNKEWMLDKRYCLGAPAVIRNKKK